MSLKRLNVSLPASLIQQIQSEYLARRGSAHGAMQEALSRGAELALAEMAGVSPVEKESNLSYNPKDATGIITSLSSAAESIIEAMLALRRSIEEQINASDPTSPSKQNLADQIIQINTAIDGVTRSAEEFTKSISPDARRKRYRDR